jgi:predicted permease
MRLKHCLYTVPLRLRSIFRRPQVERELEDELQYHLDMKIEENLEKGMSGGEARRSALIALGGLDQEKEECRDARGINLIETTIQDLLYGTRILRKSPGFSAVAVVTLALGIGAATAMFSAVYGVLLRPFPYAEPDRLAALWCSEPSRGVPRMGWALPDLREVASGNRSFDALAGYYYRDFNLASGTPERVSGQCVSAGLFPLLGVSPALGRTFTAEEESYGRQKVVVLSDVLWKRRFGARLDAIGESIRLNGDLHTIIGVMPAGFQFPDSSAQLWVPLSFAPSDGLGTRDNHFINAIARLRPGATVGTARREVRAVARRLQKEFSENTGIEADVTDYVTMVVGDVRPGLRVLFGAVGILLLIACVNVANLLLSKATERQRELSVRAALGASRGRLVRQLISEGAPLGFLGACLGLLLSDWLVHLIRTFGPAEIPRLRSIEIDVWTLAFAVAVTLFSVLLFSLAPALSLARVPVSDSLKESGRSHTGGSRAGRSRSALVVAEITLSLVLVVGAGLLVRTVQRLAEVDPGFQPGNILTMSVTLPAGQYPETQPGKTAGFFEELTHRLARIPGVTAAGASTAMPIANWGIWGKYFTVEEHPASRLADVPLIQYRQVTPGYLRTLGIRLLEGRFFTDQDGAAGPLVAVINNSARQRFFANESPLGRHVSLGPPESLIANLLPAPDFCLPRLTVIGVIGDVRQSGLMRPIEPEIYALHRQGTITYNETPATKMFLFLKADGDPLRFAAAARAAVQAIDPEQPLADLATMQERLDASVAPQRFQLFLFALFAAAALALAAVGVFGVISCSVHSRLHEIGIRMALGASSTDIFGMVVRQAVRLGLAGIGLGSLLGLAATRLMSSILFEVRPNDAVSFVGAVTVLAAVVFVAALLPSVRAARTEPLSVLRTE